MTRDESNDAMRTRASMAWTLAITSIALFMVVLDNLVVSATIVGSLAAGAGLLGLFVAWELRAAAPMVPMRMFFAPLANTILGSVRADEEGKASGVNSAVREVGGLLGVAGLASIFSSAAATGRRRRSSTGSCPPRPSAPPPSAPARS